MLVCTGNYKDYALQDFDEKSHFADQIGLCSIDPVSLIYPD